MPDSLRVVRHIEQRFTYFWPIFVLKFGINFWESSGVGISMGYHEKEGEVDEARVDLNLKNPDMRQTSSQ